MGDCQTPKCHLKGNLIVKRPTDEELAKGVTDIMRKGWSERTCSLKAWQQTNFAAQFNSRKF